MRFRGIGLAAAVMLVGVAADQGEAQAAQVNVSAAICGMTVSGTSWGNVAGPYLLTRTQNGGVSNPDIYAHDMTCSIPRLPVSSGTRSVVIDGNGIVGGPITCTVYSYAYNGTLQSSFAYGTQTGQFDISGSLTPGSVWDYFTLKCTLAPGNKASLRGITVLEY
jgi:hypothetical protein